HCDANVHHLADHIIEWYRRRMSHSARPTTVTRVIGRGERAVRMVRNLVVELESGERFELNEQTARIGSHAPNGVVLSDPTVSRHHREITATENGYRAVDLGSSNGTWLGGVRVGEIVFTERVTLQLGETRVELAPADEETPVASSPRVSFGGLAG